jgi:hypothetical protein
MFLAVVMSLTACYESFSGVRPVSQTSYTPVTQIRQNSPEHNEALRILKQYSPTGYHIVYTIDTFPAVIQYHGYPISISITSFDSFVDEAPSDLNTLVHEECHNYSTYVMYLLNLQNPAFSHNKQYTCYYVDSESILVEVTENFPSGEIERIVPDAVRSFRYNTYVYPSSAAQSTQREGIFGLLDE